MSRGIFIMCMSRGSVGAGLRYDRTKFDLNVTTFYDLGLVARIQSFELYSSFNLIQTA